MLNFTKLPRFFDQANKNKSPPKKKSKWKMYLMISSMGGSQLLPVKEFLDIPNSKSLLSVGTS